MGEERWLFLDQRWFVLDSTTSIIWSKWGAQPTAGLPAQILFSERAWKAAPIGGVKRPFNPVRLRLSNWHNYQCQVRHV